MNIGYWVIMSPVFIISIIGIWYFLPRCIYLFRPSATQSHFRERPSAKIVEREDVQKLISELKANNFEYIGIKVEKPLLWRPLVEEVSLRSIEAQTFASIFINKRKARYYFFTPFTEGQIVLTTNSSFPIVNNDEIIQSRVALDEPKQVLTIHRNCVDLFIEKGHTPFKEYTKQTRIDATNMYYGSNFVRKHMRTLGVISLIFFLVSCLFFILPIIR